MATSTPTATATATTNVTAPPHNAAKSGLSTGPDNVSLYSVPTEAEALFKQGILANPLITPSLPSNVSAYAAPIKITGTLKPSLPVNWRFAESVTALQALAGTMINALLDKKYNLPPQQITIDTDHAQLFVMSCFLWQFSDPSGQPISFSTATAPDSPVKPFYHSKFRSCDVHGASSSPYRRMATNIYRTRDARYFHLHGSLNPDPVTASLGLPRDDAERTSLADAMQPYVARIAQLDSAALQTLQSDVVKQAGTIAWSADEYCASAHGRANAHVGLWETHERANAAQPAVWWPRTEQTGVARPLAGLKVVDLTRIIAAPAITRGLAEYGASVMRVTASHLPDFDVLHPDLSWGKWNCSLDLRQEGDREKLKALIMEADVVISGYRPGVMEKWGFGPEDVLEMTKDRESGIIVARENCYGWHGPWKDRSGWQQISDTNCGVALEFGRALGLDEAVMPIFPNSDYCTGINGFCGIVDAILRRGEIGGSYLVDIALNHYSQWLINTCGTYPESVWQDLWERSGKPQFRHFDNMSVSLPKALGILTRPGSSGLNVMKEDHFEERDAPNLGVKIRTVKPILNFPGGMVRPGFSVGARGNGADVARWPEDLMSQTVQ